jgi:phenylacetate-CoA ligase
MGDTLAQLFAGNDGPGSPMTAARLWLSPRLRRHFVEAQARVAVLDAMKTEEWQSRQLAVLQHVWADACADLPHYRNLVAKDRAPKQLRSWDDVRSIPILTRSTLQEQPDQFIRRSRPPLNSMTTAGSTGTPLTIGMTRVERDLMRVVKIATWLPFGYTPSSRVFLMWGHSHLLGTGTRGKLNHLKRTMADRLLGYRRVDAYRLDRAACEKYAEMLIRFKPIGLIGYASALDLFARYTVGYRARFRSLGVRFVLSTAEAPPRLDTISRVEDLFGCPVVQEYGGAEFGQVAFKCGGEPFEVYADLNYVEAEAPLEHDSGAHPLLVTALYPRYVPLIRYRVGDAVTAPRRLANSHVHAFDAVAGRINDVIELAPGEFIHSVAVFHCIHQEAAVHGIQMVLTDTGIIILLVATPADRAALEDRIRRRLSQVHRVLGGARFEYAEDLQPNRAGKRRWYVDNRTTVSCVASQVS